MAPVANAKPEPDSETETESEPEFELFLAEPQGVCAISIYTLTFLCSSNLLCNLSQVLMLAYANSFEYFGYFWNGLKGCGWAKTQK